MPRKVTVVSVTSREALAAMSKIKDHEPAEWSIFMTKHTKRDQNSGGAPPGEEEILCRRQSWVPWQLVPAPIGMVS